MTDTSHTTDPQCADWAPAGQRLRTIRLALGLSEAQAAAECGVSRRTYRRYERGNSWPRQGRLVKLIAFAETHGFSFGWLLLGISSSSEEMRSGKLIVLPTVSTDSRQAEVAWRILRLLPHDRKAAEKVLNMAKILLERIDEQPAQVVRLPSA